MNKNQPEIVLLVDPIVIVFVDDIINEAVRIIVSGAREDSSKAALIKKPRKDTREEVIDEFVKKLLLESYLEACARKRAAILNDPSYSYAKHLKKVQPIGAEPRFIWPDDYLFWIDSVINEAMLMSVRLRSDEEALQRWIQYRSIPTLRIKVKTTEPEEKKKIIPVPKEEKVQDIRKSLHTHPPLTAAPDGRFQASGIFSQTAFERSHQHRERTKHLYLKLIILFICCVLMYIGIFFLDKLLKKLLT